MAAPVLQLRRDKDGLPFRFELLCSYGQKRQAKAGGMGQASWNPREKKWTYPIDPQIISSLWDAFDGELTFDADLERYLNELVAEQERILDASMDESEFTETGPLQMLRPYQRSSLRFLLAAKRAILGHDMGVGKTVIVAATIMEANLNKVLIVVPSSAKFHWAAHIHNWAEWTPENIWVIDSSASQTWQTIRGSGPKREVLVESVLDRRTFCLIMTYDMMDTLSTILEKHQYDIVVFDEAHRLKNRDAQRTQRAMDLSKQTDFLIHVTGTPIRNDYDELWTLLKMINPRRFSSYWNFVKGNLRYSEGTWGGIEILGLRDKDAWEKMMSVFMFRKEKKEILPDLPDKIYVDLEMNMMPQQAKLYEQMEQELMMELAPLGDEDQMRFLRAPTTISKIMRLRQICLTPALIGGSNFSAKLRALTDIFEEIKETGEKVILFTMFASFLPYVREILDKLGILHDSIEGSVSARQRYYTEERLVRGEIQVVIGTIGAMGETLNLQEATTAIFCDIDWVPASNRQAEDRIHRLGIKTSPRIIRLVHPGTIEEDIISVNKHKANLTGDAIGGVEVMRVMLARLRGEDNE